ncbi:CDP-glucose 4,6-dehydratase [sulfur-oxidizing endosymbiont of Gigantopelta aegis]|uniref:CDP-glucose 4,6-dehydratase n=1 Tax=sulfur-oxidizing endosymbiont of Gigantopelta aegis TaxID=2794934 RepID=UPI0018DD056D|nr:CDP-glucose 4,6-dehydratase [sulfur-oxidizing endosymbiont of Gigantopelta aegis]
MIESNFWQGRKVFLTGHTGFKGSWLSLWLKQLGAVVTGYALEPPTSPALFNDAGINHALKKHIHGDIIDGASLSRAMHNAEPEIVIHMAAQSLLRESYDDPLATYSTNVIGTVNLFEAIRKTVSVKAVLNITTDKCYENKEWNWGYREIEPMGGYDPYSSSKACAELVSSAYRQSFFQHSGVALATARAGNVIGGGDWATDRIVPDAMRAFMDKRILFVRNPLAIRPWQHVLEPLAGYLLLCQQLLQAPEQFSEPWNFGPKDEDAQPVSRLADIMSENWGASAQWALDKEAHPHEARFLKLDCSKARTQLKWQPLWDLERALTESVRWYKAWHNQENMHQFTLQQINSYQEELQSQ